MASNSQTFFLLNKAQSFYIISNFFATGAVFDKGKLVSELFICIIPTAFNQDIQILFSPIIWRLMLVFECKAIPLLYYDTHKMMFFWFSYQHLSYVIITLYQRVNSTNHHKLYTFYPGMCCLTQQSHKRFASKDRNLHPFKERYINLTVVMNCRDTAYINNHQNLDMTRIFNYHITMIKKQNIVPKLINLHSMLFRIIITHLLCISKSENSTKRDT